MYSGMVITKNITFKSLGVKPGESIVLISSKSKSRSCDDEIQKWVQITQDMEAFNEKMQLILNEDNAREAARLWDVVLSKIERKPRSFRRLCLALSENNKLRDAEENEENESNQLSTDYTIPDYPSTDPLPVFFSHDDKDDYCSMAKDESLLTMAETISPILRS